MTGKPHDAAANFNNTYQNLRRHRAVLPAVARLFYFSILCNCSMVCCVLDLEYSCWVWQTEL